MNVDSHKDQSVPRQSNGLDQFFASIRGEQGLSILDLGGASQATISFVTELGHRICTEDFLRSVDFAFGKGDLVANQSDSAQIDAFLQNNLVYQIDRFDGVLIWDSLEYLAPPLLTATIDRLHYIVRPNSYLFALFHSDERLQPRQSFSYRVAGPKTVHLSPNGIRQPLQYFNTRALEKLFQRFQSVKFFLTRDNLRELIIKR